ncbi:MAG: hypothetical protein HQ596_04960 [Candidatus Saganbacteria bacterium]|nr:hypothetical protein [Candidatus Saganbacteria bacterium]
MRLSRTAIVGPKYRFAQHTDRTCVEYEWRGSQHSIPIGLKAVPSSKPTTFKIILFDQDGERVGENESIISGDSAYLFRIKLDENMRGIGLAPVLTNISLFHLMSTCGLSPQALYVKRVMSDRSSMLGALVNVLNFGFSEMRKASVESLIRHAERPTADKRLEFVEGRGGIPVPVMRIGRRRVVFYPSLREKVVVALMEDVEGLETLLRYRHAFLTRTDYYLCSEAIEIMPDYMALLPENPEIIV